MFNMSGQNVNFVPGGPKKLAHFLYALSTYAFTSLLHQILTDFQIYFTV